MVSLVKSQAVELARSGITVNCVAPRWVDMERCVDALANGGEARIAVGISVGRVASPQDVAAAAVMLCIPGISHLVCEVVNVNGGSVLAG